MFERPTNGTIEWVRAPGAGTLYELRSNDHAIATLRRETRLGALATATAGARQWILRRTGLFRSKAMIRCWNAPRWEAVFEPGWGGPGQITLADGRVLSWGRMQFWEPEWALRDERQRLLLRIAPSMTATRGALRVTREGAKREDAAMLAVFAWYLVTLEFGESVYEEEAQVLANAAP